MDDAAWVAAFHRIGERVRERVAPLLGSAAGRVELGRGAGGDRTLALDRDAEEEVLVELRRLAAAGARCTVLSEEVGRIDLGSPYPLIFVDPVDGSLNAKRGVPVCGLMVSLLDGPTLGDVRIGVVHDLVSGERWHAIRGAGMFHEGRGVHAPAFTGSRIEVLGLEGSARWLERIWPLVQAAGKLRQLGSVAIALACASTGALDVFCSAKHGRAFDMTAGMLMVREAGGVITDVAGNSIEHLPAGLEQRGSVLAAAAPEAHALALRHLRAAG